MIFAEHSAISNDHQIAFFLRSEIAEILGLKISLNGFWSWLCFVLFSVSGVSETVLTELHRQTLQGGNEKELMSS